MGEKVCAALIPCAVVLEILIYGFASCFDDRRSSPVKPGHTFDDVTRLARNSPCLFSYSISFLIFLTKF